MAKLEFSRDGVMRYRIRSLNLPYQTSYALQRHSLRLDA